MNNGINSKIGKNFKKVECLCIGAQKAGTTWLNEQLLNHAELCLPPIKEVHYFDFVYSPSDREWIVDHYRRPAKYHIPKLMEADGEVDWESVAYYAQILALMLSGHVTEEWYHSIYSLCKNENGLKVDITPEYLPMPIEAIKAIYEYNPNMKLIALLREPVSRAISAARMMLKRRNVSQPADNLWWTIVKGNGIIEKSCYAHQLENWLQVFPKEQFLVIPYEQIAKSPLTIINNVCDFLSISPVENSNLLYERVHAGKKYSVPIEIEKWIEFRLKDEIAATKKMFPILSEWWT